MSNTTSTPRALLHSIWRHRSLIRAFATREVSTRYRGSFLGLLWSFFTPFLMLAVYTFVFGFVYKARWNGVDDGNQFRFALVLFAGLIVFNLFAECMNRAPSLILGHATYVKKVVFPLETLPFVALFSAVYHMLISLGVWLLAYVILFDVPHATVLLLPLVILPFALFIMGLSWALASLGVFLRDVSQFIGVVVMTLMFMSPVFYPASALPEAYRHILYLNPLTLTIEITREVLYWGKLPNFTMLGIYWLATGVIAWLGFAWFQKTRKGFADVL